MDLLVEDLLPERALGLTPVKIVEIDNLLILDSPLKYRHQRTILKKHKNPMLKLLRLKLGEIHQNLVVSLSKKKLKSMKFYQLQSSH
jgi:hypothetical protein